MGTHPRRLHFARGLCRAFRTGAFLFIWYAKSSPSNRTRARRASCGSIGSPGIFAMHKGVCYAIECKGDKGRPSDTQKEF